MRYPKALSSASASASSSIHSARRLLFQNNNSVSSGSVKSDTERRLLSVSSSALAKRVAVPTRRSNGAVFLLDGANHSSGVPLLFRSLTTTTTFPPGDDAKNSHTDESEQGQHRASVETTTRRGNGSNSIDNNNFDQNSLASAGVVDRQVEELIGKIRSIQPTSIRDDRIVEEVLEDAVGLLRQQIIAIKNPNSKTTTTTDNNDLKTETSSSSLVTNNESFTYNQGALIVQSMHDLFQLWISMHFQRTTRPQTSRPFQILVEAWALAATTTHNINNQYTPSSANGAKIDIDGEVDVDAASRACQVLQRWYELLGGSVDLSPALEDYNLVLEAYAASTTNLAAKAKRVFGEQQLTPALTTTTTTMDDGANKATMEWTVKEQLKLTSLAFEAWDIVRELKGWGYTMTPTMETNAHLVRCLSNVITTISYNHHLDTKLNAKTAWHRLQMIMKEGIQPLEAKLERQSSKRVPAVMIFDSPKHSRHDNTAEYFFLLQALCDSLRAAKTFTQQSNQSRDKVAAVLIDDKEDQLMDDVMSWQEWCVSLMKIVLGKNSDRLTAALDYGASNLLPYEQGDYTMKTTLSPVYRMTLKGCEALQFLLRQYPLHDYTDQQQQHQYGEEASMPVAFEVNAILEQLEALGAQFIKDEKDKHHSYIALMRNYVHAIRAWKAEIPFMSVDDKTDAEQICEAILQRLTNQHRELVEIGNLRHREGGQALFDRDVYKRMRLLSFNCLMQAKFFAGQGEEVHEIFKTIREHRINPDTISYGAVFKALADSSRSDAAPIAHKMLQTMRKQWRQDPLSPASVKPTSQHFASVLVAWSRNPSRGGIAATKALELFDQLHEDYKEASNDLDFKPSPILYSALLTTLARCRERSDAINARTLELVHEAVFPLGSSNNSVLYVSAMNALSRAGTLEAAQVAQLLLDDMVDQYNRMGNTTIKPNLSIYGTCMYAWSRAAEKGQSQDAAQRIEELIARLESDFRASGNHPSLMPSTRTYMALLNSIVSTGGSDVGDRAEAVLQRMQEKAAVGEAEFPDEQVFCKVIDAHKVAGTDDCGQKAEAVFDQMKEAYEMGGNANARPTALAYKSVIQAWSRSPREDKATQCARLLREMQNAFNDRGDLQIKPDAATFVAILNCCAYTPASAIEHYREEAVRIALQTLVDLHHHGIAPVPYMYFLVLKTLHDNVREGRKRNRMASAVFEDCCTNGLVNHAVLDGLRLCSQTLYYSLPSELPKQWSHSVQKKEKYFRPMMQKSGGDTVGK